MIINSNAMDLVFGRDGRFAKNLISNLGEKFTYSLNYTNFTSKAFEVDCSINEIEFAYWTYGSGNSNSIKSNGELDALLKLLELLRFKKMVISNFVYISTGGSIYGDGCKFANENTIPNPTSSYALNKLKCEKLIKEEMIKYVKNVCIFRLANAYSLEENLNNPKGLIENLLFSAIKKKRLDIFVNPLSERQYGTHYDYAKIITRAARIISHQEKARVTVINMYPPFTLSIFEIARSISDLFQIELSAIVKIEKRELVDDSFRLSSTREEVWQVSELWSDFKFTLVSGLNNVSNRLF